MYAHYRQLWNAFEDFECTLLAFSFDEEGNSCCRWRISGVHVKPLWDQPAPADKRVVCLYGITQVQYERGQFRLVRIRNSYRLPLFSARDKELVEESKDDAAAAASSRRGGSKKTK